MYVDRILYPIETLGPGKRIVIWTVGCTKHCAHCANPELWDPAGRNNIAIKDLAQIIGNLCRENSVDGITFTGGDPLEQAEELLPLLRLIKDSVPDVLVYTGYTREELELLVDNQMLESLVSVLIDGPYIDEQNDERCVHRGSSNQCIYYFDEDRRKDYETYLRSGRKIQNIVMGDRLISEGNHKRKKD